MTLAADKPRAVILIGDIRCSLAARRAGMVECFMKINDPKILAELQTAFDEYETALIENHPEVLVRLFWRDPRTIRYGVAENLYGHDKIAAYRHQRADAGGPVKRRATRRVVTTYGESFGTTNIEFVRDATGKRGRQSQTWMRTPEGWRVVAAHVSLIEESD
jgi:hypothetical protein